MRKSMVFEGAAVTLLLLLVFLLLAMLLGGSQETQIGGMGQASYFYTGNDGTLYAFTDNDIQAIDDKGNRLWDLPVPEKWRIGYGWYYYPDDVQNLLGAASTPSVDNITVQPGDPIAFSNNGTLYVYLVPNETYSGHSVPSAVDGRMDEGIIAISRAGKILWSLPLKSLAANFIIVRQPDVPNGTAVPLVGPSYSDVKIYAQGHRVYVFHDYNETIIDQNGQILWNLANISDPASVDENGYVYCVPSREPTETYPQPFIPSTYYAYRWPGVIMADYRVPSAIIDAYYPNGTLYWRAYPGELLFRQYIGRNPMPLYNNGTLYAPLIDGLKALDHNGTEKWSKKLDSNDFSFEYTDYDNHTQHMVGDFRIYESMPFDSKGNVYMEYVSRGYMPYPHLTSYLSKNLYLLTWSPDGKERSRVKFFKDIYVSVYDGIGYATSDSMKPRPPAFFPDAADNLTSLGTEELVAIEIGENKERWNYTFPVDNPMIGVLYKNNSEELIGIDNNDWGRFGRIVESRVEVPEVVTSSGRVYVYFRSKNWDSPIVYGQSKCAYVSGVYAFDQNGTLLWNKTISPGAYSMGVAGNGTIFYRTGGGRLVVTGAGAATGFALTTLAYLFIRFLCLGAVARAKARMNKNDNRNKVYEFIVRNPGSTLYEISRGTGMNIGTIRYHLFILGLNHKIVSSRMDGKYIRHFTNSNTYSKEEQLILSLARRGTMGKILTLLLQKPGISNVQISRELGVTESEVSRYMGELAEKGMVVKGSAGKECAYVIEDTKRPSIAGALKRLDGS